MQRSDLSEREAIDRLGSRESILSSLKRGKDGYKHHTDASVMFYTYQQKFRNTHELEGDVKFLLLPTVIEETIREKFEAARPMNSPEDLVCYLTNISKVLDISVALLCPGEYTRNYLQTTAETESTAEAGLTGKEKNILKLVRQLTFLNESLRNNPDVRSYFSPYNDTNDVTRGLKQFAVQLLCADGTDLSKFDKAAFEFFYDIDDTSRSTIAIPDFGITEDARLCSKRNFASMFAAKSEILASLGVQIPQLETHGAPAIAPSDLEPVAEQGHNFIATIIGLFMAIAALFKRQQPDEAAHNDDIDDIDETDETDESIIDEPMTDEYKSHII